MVTFSGVFAAEGLMARHREPNQFAWSKAPAVVTKPSKPEAARLVKVVLSLDLLFRVPEGFCVPSTMFTVYVAAQVPMEQSKTARKRISFRFILCYLLLFMFYLPPPRGLDTTLISTHNGNVDNHHLVQEKTILV